MPLRNPVGGVKAPRTRYLGHVRDLAIYLVDGERVRNELDIDFTCGGNEARTPAALTVGVLCCRARGVVREAASDDNPIT